MTMKLDPLRIATAIEMIHAETRFRVYPCHPLHVSCVLYCVCVYVFNVMSATRLLCIQCRSEPLRISWRRGQPCEGHDHGQHSGFLEHRDVGDHPDPTEQWTIRDAQDSDRGCKNNSHPDLYLCGVCQGPVTQEFVYVCIDVDNIFLRSESE